MTRTNYLLDDAGGALPWSALNSFVINLKSDSALARDLGKATGWEDLIRTNMILADIYDLLQVINADLVSLGHGHPKKIKPYPRPGRESDTKRIGKGALPKKELREWFRRKENGRKV